MLIIGCGNRDRGDDAAGVLAAERLRTLGVPAVICSGESLELMAAWNDAPDVLVIDCVVTGARGGTVHVWDAGLPLAFSKPDASTHGLGVGQAIELSRVLGCLPRRLRIYGIEGRDFEIGASVTPEVVRGIDEVVTRIRNETEH